MIDGISRRFLFEINKRENPATISPRDVCWFDFAQRTVRSAIPKMVMWQQGRQLGAPEVSNIAQ